jgi:peptidyl-prolyl cis-trans isomerase C
VDRSYDAVRALALLPIFLALIVSPGAADTEVIATVNGTPITRKQLTDVVDGTRTLEKQAPDATTTAHIRRGALDSLIDFEVLYQASVAGGPAVTEAEVGQEISRSMSRFPDEDSFRAALARKGMTAADLQQETRRMIAVNRYLERTIYRGIDISPEEVAQFYQSHRAEFHQPAEVRVSHILIRLDPEASEAQRQIARGKAADILIQIRGGADFAELARKYSEDRSTAAQGGDLGFFARGTMVEAFEEPVFSLLPGQVTSVFETQYGFHIAKVTDRKLEGTRSLDDVRDTIREHITGIERERRQAKHVEELRRRATIEIYDPELAR